MNPDTTAQEKEVVRNVYQEIADEYDERIPGFTMIDQRFTETEMTFVMSKVDASDDVLDMGCGTGRFTIPLAQHARHVTGLDVSGAMIARARAKAGQAEVSIDFRESDMEQLPFEDNSFDAIVCMLALMHIPLESRQKVFLEASRVLRPGGSMIISVKNAIFERLSRADRFAVVDITDVEAKQLIFTHTRSGKDLVAPWYSFSPQDLDRLFALAGLRMVDLQGNIPLSAWISDTILADPGVGQTVRAIERLLGDLPPFNFLGYHILAEAVKPLR